MGKTTIDSAATAAATPATAETEPGLYVTTSVDRRVLVAGEYWAGASHVPARQFDQAQLLELRTSKLVSVEDKPIAVPALAGA